MIIKDIPILQKMQKCTQIQWKIIIKQKKSIAINNQEPAEFIRNWLFKNQTIDKAWNVISKEIISKDATFWYIYNNKVYYCILNEKDNSKAKWKSVNLKTGKTATTSMTIKSCHELLWSHLVCAISI